MLDKERNFYIWNVVIVFLVFLIAGKIIEAILMLILGHLIEIKYEIKKLNKHRKEL